MGRNFLDTLYTDFPGVVLKELFSFQINKIFLPTQILFSSSEHKKIVTITVTARGEGEGGKELAKESIQLTIHLRPLKARISGAKEYIIGEDSTVPISLDCSRSRDPDDSATKPTCTWSCDESVSTWVPNYYGVKWHLLEGARGYLWFGVCSQVFKNRDQGADFFLDNCG